MRDTTPLSAVVADFVVEWRQRIDAGFCVNANSRAAVLEWLSVQFISPKALKACTDEWFAKAKRRAKDECTWRSFKAHVEDWRYWRNFESQARAENAARKEQAAHALPSAQARERIRRILADLEKEHGGNRAS